jgi:NADH-quinone oxidoreductase subunit H
LFPVQYGSNFVPPLIFFIAGALALYHGLNPARKLDRITLPIVALAAWAIALLFLIPAAQPFLVPLFWFAAKTGFLLFTFIWVRGTLPRFRYDQLMGFAWKFLFPVALINLLITGLMVALF